MKPEAHSWMQKAYSLQVTISAPTGLVVTAFTTAKPIVATAEEALQAHTDFRDKLLSICSGSSQVPIVLYDRTEKALVSSTVIPSDMLRSSAVNVMLVAESA